MGANYMEKDNTLTSDKESVSSEEEVAITKASDIITKENVGKTIRAVKDLAKNVKSKATRVANAAKKTVAKKIDVVFYVQYQGKEVCNQKIQEKIYEEWLKSHKLSEIKTLDVYLKVEDDTVYCLINGEINIDLKLS